MLFLYFSILTVISIFSPAYTMLLQIMLPRHTANSRALPQAHIGSAQPARRIFADGQMPAAPVKNDSASAETQNADGSGARCESKVYAPRFSAVPVNRRPVLTRCAAPNGWRYARPIRSLKEPRSRHGGSGSMTASARLAQRLAPSPTLASQLNSSNRLVWTSTFKVCRTHLFRSL